MLLSFTSGAIAMGYAVSGLFFLRFWRRTKDPLFVFFTVAFWLFAFNQTLLGLSGLPGEEQSFLYLLRLCGFVLIGLAVLVKNASQTPPGPARRR